MPLSDLPPWVSEPVRNALKGSPGASNILGDLGIDLSQFDPAAMAEQEASSNPLTHASLATSQRISLLPGWARDLKILGLGKETEAPEMFVFMRDTERITRAAQYGSLGLPEGQLDSGMQLPGRPESNVTTTTTETSQAQTVTRALNQPYLWDDSEVKEAMTRMQEAGLDVKSFDDVNSVWQGLVERAAKTYTFSDGKKKVTPWDVLDLIKREDESANGSQFDDENFTATSTSRSVQDISEGEAWSVLQSNLSRMLGRDPSDDEIRDFTFRMGQLAAANPAISKTVATYKDGRLQSSNTTEVDSGFTADDMMKTSYDEAQRDHEYAEYQSATTYFNAVQSALGEIGG